MNSKILISTAYLPPLQYFSLIKASDNIFIEKEENFLKQTFRNRCYILSSHGQQMLSVPVYSSGIQKTKISEARIDYSKKWQQVHLRAIMSSYRASPYFEFYFEKVENIILRNKIFLLDLNMDLLLLMLDFLKMKKSVSYTGDFEPVNSSPCDYRYKISPKSEPLFKPERYTRVFDFSDIPHLSILDLLFNMGPDAINYI